MHYNGIIFLVHCELGLWKHHTRKMKIQQRAYLQERVEWNPEQEDVGKSFNKSEGSIHNPVGKPFGVVIFLCRFDGFNAFYVKQNVATYEQYAGYKKPMKLAKNVPPYPIIR